MLTRKSNYHNLNVSIIKYFVTEYSSRNIQLMCSYYIPKAPPTVFTVSQMHCLSSAQTLKPPDSFSKFLGYKVIQSCQSKNLEHILERNSLGESTWNLVLKNIHKEFFVGTSIHLIQYNNDFNILFYVLFDTIRHSWSHLSGSAMAFQTVSF